MLRLTDSAARLSWRLVSESARSANPYDRGKALTRALIDVQLAESEHARLVGRGLAKFRRFSVCVDVYVCVYTDPQPMRHCVAVLAVVPGLATCRIAARTR